MTDNVSQDFVFGTLATDALRLAQLRAASAGVAHNHEIIPPDPRAGQAVEVRVSLGPQVAAEHVTCYYSTDGRDPAGQRGVASTGTALELTRAGSVWDTLLWGYRELWSGSIPPQPEQMLVRYRLEAWSEQGSSWAAEIAGVAGGERPPGVSELDAEMFADWALWPVRRAGSYAYHVDDERVPAWLREAVIYHVFIDRFATTGGQPFHTPDTPGGLYGGTLRGVCERLDYIASLGATCLWLSPLFPSPSHHGYDATDYTSVEPRLGTAEDLRALTDAAHERGMRVILDYVVNHMSWEHPAFVAARADHGSPEAAWFTFTRWPDQYLTFFGVQDHPQINSDDPGAQRYMIESAIYWLRCGLDGCRCDYANGPSHAFWSAFRAATRAAKPDSITLGEVVETPALQRTYQGRMDGCLDFMLLQALRQFFAFESMSAPAFDAFLQRHLAFFEGDFVLPSFLDNHDMNRFLWVVRGDTRRLKLAAMCQFTLPHPPIIYYGTEVGLAQQRDVRYADGSGHPEESRLPMLWGEQQDQGLLDFYRRLVWLRRSTPGLWQATRTTLQANDAGLYIYQCSDTTRIALVALNRSSNERNVRLDSGHAHHVLLASEDTTALYGNALFLPPFGGAVIAQGAW